MSRAMDNFLNRLINEAEDSASGPPAVQVVFAPGTGSVGGTLGRMKEEDGIFVLNTFVAPGNIPQAQLRQEDLIMVEMFFESDAVQRIVKEREKSRIEVPGVLS